MPADLRESATKEEETKSKLKKLNSLRTESNTYAFIQCKIEREKKKSRNGRRSYLQERVWVVADARSKESRVEI